jgi:hypothetical protein
MMVADGVGLGLAAGRMECLIGAVILGALLGGCSSTSHAFRLNPEQEPEQYRVTCKQRFHFCESEARERCEGEYQELSRLSNRPEQTLVKDSVLSSTGPAKGHANWEGELTVECGRALPALRLQRSADAVPAAGENAGRTTDKEPGLPSSSSGGPSTPSSERVCVPGVTQACLGPGACNGAQACLETGLGFGTCDCGRVVPDQGKPPPTATTSTSAPEVETPTP